MRPRASESPSATANVWTAADEARRQALRHPISRWYVCPAVCSVALRLVPTRVRPTHLTTVGTLTLFVAGGLVALRIDLLPLAALMVWLAWFLDLTDGALARLQGTSSPRGAWLDANLDELADVAVHAAVAIAVAPQIGVAWSTGLLIAFVAGKYLFAFSLTSEQEFGSSNTNEAEAESHAPTSLWRRLYHAPGNIDVRTHLLIAALLTGWLWAELAFVGVYFSVRWLVRYGLVLRRLEGAAR